MMVAPAAIAVGRAGVLNDGGRDTRADDDDRAD
jgi:hypothetical protein